MIYTVNYKLPEGFYYGNDNRMHYDWFGLTEEDKLWLAAGLVDLSEGDK